MNAAALGAHFVAHPEDLLRVDHTRNRRRTPQKQLLRFGHLTALEGDIRVLGQPFQLIQSLLFCFRPGIFDNSNPFNIT
jgi:hypothetical protein